VNISLDSPLGGDPKLVYVVLNKRRVLLRTGNNIAMLSIGEFSRITGLSVKALRLYHQKRLLVPTCMDENSGYRYYDERAIEKAHVIVRLRDMAFSLGEIGEILRSCDDEADVLEYLARQKQAIQARIRQHRNILVSLEQIIKKEQEARIAMERSTFDVERKTLEPMLIAGVRMKGKYSDCGKGFAKIGKALGRHLCGKPLCLYYDGEYRENDADLEACIPLRKQVEVEGVSVRELPGGRCVALVHQGPYEELGRSYAKILGHIKEKGYKTLLPSREVYIKGPGMLFKGNPKNYLTEIQILIE